MNKFNVEVTTQITRTYLVEAEDEDQAQYIWEEFQPLPGEAVETSVEVFECDEDEDD